MLTPSLHDGPSGPVPAPAGAAFAPAPAPPHDHRRAERATMVVLALTLVTMVAEIGAGWWTNSMALLADGWHMAMHAAAMGVAVAAYRFARRHQHSPRFAFGAGKAADLGAFANAVMLAVVAVMVGAESMTRLVSPGPIDFGAAMLVATIGLGVNLLSAWLLRDAPHAHGCCAGPAHPDHNREAAFAHVLSDALTSVLALVALYCGRRFGLVWLDPLMGVVGAVVILRWSAALVKRAGGVLLDAAPADGTAERVREIVEGHGDEVRSLRVWPIAAGRHAVALGVASRQDVAYRAELAALPGVAHLSVDCAAPVVPRFQILAPVPAGHAHAHAGHGHGPKAACCGHAH